MTPQERYEEMKQAAEDIEKLQQEEKRREGFFCSLLSPLSLSLYLYLSLLAKSLFNMIRLTHYWCFFCFFICRGVVGCSTRTR
jgi:Mg2+/citrate symporter